MRAGTFHQKMKTRRKVERIVQVSTAIFSLVDEPHPTHMTNDKMALFTWTILAALLLLAIFWWNVPGSLLSFYRKRKAVNRLPGWPRHWLWGNLHQIGADEKTMIKNIQYIRKTGYKITRLWIGPLRPVVVIHHCEPLRQVLKEPKNRSSYQRFDPWLGDGLLISEGKKWYRNRRLLTPAFHFEILKPYMSVYNSSVEILLSKWSAASGKKEPVKLFETISLMSLDIILQCAFSYQSDCQNVTNGLPYITCIYELVNIFAKRRLNMLYQFDWIFWLSSDGRRMKEACRIVHDYSENVIRERKKALGLDGSGAKITLEVAAKKRKCLDFLDILLTAVDEDGNGLTDLEIRNEVDTFMFEGHDTTTSGMSWTLYCLAKYPEHQEKVREEVRNVLDGREWLEYDDLKELRYTQWCIKEAMRLYPPVFAIAREASEDIELDGYMIPKGSNLGVLIHSIHRHPDIWENPDEFDPLRFHPDNAEGRDPFAYIPFSAGYRNCIGQNFAMNEMRTVIASVVHRFSLSLVEGHKVERVPLVILRAKDDIKINLQSLF